MILYISSLVWVFVQFIFYLGSVKSTRSGKPGPASHVKRQPSKRNAENRQDYIVKLTKTSFRIKGKIMNNNVYWIVEAAIKDGELDNLRNLINEMADAGQANEPGTLNYEWAISEDRKTCHLYERYADSAAALIHLGTFNERYAQRLMAAVDVTRFVVYGDPNNEVKAAFAGSDAVFMSPFGGFSR
jgi:quinol monooxygenase YgiN